LGPSIFIHAGIFELSSDEDIIRLKSLDARGVNLDPYKARLVKNDIPFRMTHKPLKSSDEFRFISYFYESGYSKDQIQHHGGIFLEKHQFSQSITPLNEEARGYVVLACQKTTDTDTDTYDLIGVQIPFGWSLIIEDQCIHGDASLEGYYGFCMTSNHTTMRTADCVFIKNKKTKNNVDIVLDTNSDHSTPLYNPFKCVIYRSNTKEVELAKSIRQSRFIFNPLSWGFRVVKGCSQQVLDS